MKKILITGADGFIGSQVLPLLLERGYEVHAVVLADHPPDRRNEGLYYHRCDLLDDREMRELFAAVKPSHLLHLAWYMKHKEYWESPLNLRWVQASLGLYFSFAENGGERVVTAGTCAEYDWSHGCCSEETTPRIPSTLYGLSKNSLQEMLQRLAPLLGISSSWGRLFFLYGPREQPPRLIPSIIRSLLTGRLAQCANPEETRDFLYVEDAAGALVKLLESDIIGAVNIASGVPVMLGDIVEMLGEKLGRPDLISSGQERPSGREPLTLIGDVRRLREEVGWAPRFTLSSGLDKTLKWWREQ